MTVTAVTQAPGLALTGEGDRWVSKTGLSPMDANDARISAVIDRLNPLVPSHFRSDYSKLSNLYLNLSRGIDVAVANHQFPSRALELPSLAKQVCQCKNDNHYQAAVLVLMMSVKSACQSGWFSDKDSEELQNLAKEVAEDFGTVSNLSAEPNCSHSVISTVMSRFYPRIKMGHVFVFLEVKPGFDAYLSDFLIPQNLRKTSQGDKIMLFVVQTDSITTSSCLISPAKVNFLLNGTGVERRTNIFVDSGPQMPMPVTNMLKFGPNLFQAIGEFNGNYIIGIAIMSEMSNPDSNVLQDHEQCALAISDSDSEIIEGPSRVSLNCPISFRRIKTPVKGHLCKHIQCFDFDNYIDINSRRPSWRCSHCNQHVSFTDLRVDKKMAKILEEAEPNISHITISPDGSWNGVMYNDDTNQDPNDKGSGDIRPPVPENLLDLTQIEDNMDFITSNDDVMKFGNIPQSQYVNPSVSIEPDQIGANMEDDYWSGVYLSSVANDQMTPAPLFQTNSFPTINGQTEDLSGSNNAPFAPQREPNTSQLQHQYQFVNSNLAEYGRFPSLPRNVSRVPTAIQALPAQQLQQRDRTRFPPMQSSQVNPYRVPQLSISTPQNQYQIPQVSSTFQNQYHNTQEPRLFPPATDWSADALRAFNGQRSVLQTPNRRIVPRGPLEASRFTPPRHPNHVFPTPGGSEENWRPSARMRGALSGQAYADAFARHVAQNQPHGTGGSMGFTNGSSGTQ